MKTRLLASIMCCGMLLPAVAQESPASLVSMLNQPVAHASASAVTLEQRAAVFSALAAMPAETDSFLCVRGVGELFKMQELAELSAQLPVLGMASGLDSLALGMSDAAVRDLQRVMPLFNALAAGEMPFADQWIAQAEPAAGLAIAAQMRETQQQRMDALVAASRDFHLAPVYMVLSSKPEAVSMLHMLAMMPMMMPVSPESGVEPVMLGDMHGICLRGEKLDLSAAGLPAEVEQQVKQNLSSARLYALLRVVDNCLVLVICSNPDEVRIPATVAESILGAPCMQQYDAQMHTQAVAIGQSSESLVNARVAANMQGYCEHASFVGSVFARVAGENPSAASAAAAVERMMQTLAKLAPAQQGAETVKIWQEDDICVEYTADACGLYFEPGKLSAYTYAEQPGTVFFMQGTPLRGYVTLDVPAVIRDAQIVFEGYKQTLAPEPRAKAEKELQDYDSTSSTLTLLADGMQRCYQSLGADSALLVQYQAADSQHVGVSLRLEVAEPAGCAEGEKQICAANEAFRALLSEQELREYDAVLQRFSVERADSALLVKSATGGLNMTPEAQSVTVPGGVVFTLRLAELADALDSAGKRDCAAAAQDVRSAAQVIQRVDGAVSTRGDRMQVLLRLRPAGK